MIDLLAEDEQFVLQLLPGDMGPVSLGPLSGRPTYATGRNASSPKVKPSRCKKPEGGLN